MPIVMQAILIHVADLEVSRQFYETLGIVFDRETEGDTVFYAAYLAHNAAFQISPLESPDQILGREPALYFGVENLDAVFTKLRQMEFIIIAIPQTVSFHGRQARICTVQDPDGRSVGLMELLPEDNSLP